MAHDSVSESARQSARLWLDRRLEDALVAERILPSPPRFVLHAASTDVAAGERAGRGGRTRTVLAARAGASRWRRAAHHDFALS